MYNVYLYGYTLCKWTDACDTRIYPLCSDVYLSIFNGTNSLKDVDRFQDTDQS